MSFNSQSVEYDFGSFDYGQNGQDYYDNSASNQRPMSGGYVNTSYQPPQQQQQYSQSTQRPSIFTPQENISSMNTDPYAGEGDIENEPPLLEELGINFDHIIAKTVAVINPFKQTDSVILDEADFTGPLVFCLALGGLLLLSGKLYFGYIYFTLVFGCVSIWLLLNLMSSTNSITLSSTVSVLGYSLLPMVLLAAVAVVVHLKGNIFGSLFALICILWCSISASKLFITATQSQNQQALIAYPCALLYGVFALLTVF